VKPPKRHVLLVSLGFSPRWDCLVRALRELGREVDATDARKFAEQPPSTSGSTAVLLLGAVEYSPRLTSEIEGRLHSIPKLGIVTQGADVWKSPLLTCCHDVVSWPCPRDELPYRLERVEAFGPPSNAVDESEVLAIFEKIGLMGRSRAFVEVLRSLRRVAPSDAPVLLEGETGTGKELVARALHRLSPRRDAPFVPVNCGAIPDSLLESEFFGYERGAFTDARASKPGLLEEADEGTLFLDEIGSLSPKGQVVLLRFLQDREYRPLGSRATHSADLRVIVATNVSLRSLVDEGRFREDLFFRLNLVHVVLPHLRRRPDDILLLARHFVKQYSPDYGLPERPFHPSTAFAMMRYSWPGNVRELENFVHRCILMNDPESEHLTGEPRPHAAPAEVPDTRGLCAVGFQQAKQDMIDDFERHYLTSLLRRTGGNISEAARKAGKERRALGKLLKRHGIQRADYVGS